MKITLKGVKANIEFESIELEKSDITMPKGVKINIELESIELEDSDIALPNPPVVIEIKRKLYSILHQVNGLPRNVKIEQIEETLTDIFAQLNDVIDNLMNAKL